MPTSPWSRASTSRGPPSTSRAASSGSCSGSSTDDHVVHCVGLKEGGPETWFAVKDSWRTAYQGQVKGYFFYRDDYLKLKVLMIMTHKDAVADLLAKFPPAD